MATIIETKAELDRLLSLLNRIDQNEKPTLKEKRYLLSIEEIEVEFDNNNTIFELPRSIDKLTNLRKIVLENCLMLKLPESIGSLINLEELYISHWRFWIPSRIWLLMI